jgi:cephalosporin hydroxylase
VIEIVEASPAPPPPSARPAYLHYLTQPSDIQAHLGLLYSLARGNVVELGTRSGVSTAALLAGVEKRGGHVWSVDIDDCAHLYAGHPQWTFRQGDSTDGATLDRWWSEHPQPKSGCIDLLLIDTEHTVEQVTAELGLWSAYMEPGSHICLHDPETFPGVRRAITTFCQAKGWPVTFILPCHGMAVIEVPK